MKIAFWDIFILVEALRLSLNSLNKYFASFFFFFFQNSRNPFHSTKIIFFINKSWKNINSVKKNYFSIILRMKIIRVFKGWGYLSLNLFHHLNRILNALIWVQVKKTIFNYFRLLWKLIPLKRSQFGTIFRSYSRVWDSMCAIFLWRKRI